VQVIFGYFITKFLHMGPLMFFLLGRATLHMTHCPTIHDKMGNWTFEALNITSHITMHTSVRPKRLTCEPVGQGRATIALHSVGLLVQFHTKTDRQLYQTN